MEVQKWGMFHGNDNKALNNISQFRFTLFQQQNCEESRLVTVTLLLADFQPMDVHR